jgi:hypothetical protein
LFTPGLSQDGFLTCLVILIKDYILLELLLPLDRNAKLRSIPVSPGSLPKSHLLLSKNFYMNFLRYFFHLLFSLHITPAYLDGPEFNLAFSTVLKACPQELLPSQPQFFNISGCPNANAF